MKQYLQHIREKAVVFLQGRYGFDELSRFLYFAALGSLLLSLIMRFALFHVLSLVLFLYMLFRTFSRNYAHRRAELYRFQSLQRKVRKPFHLYSRMWKDRKTHRYYQCPGCHTTVRITRPEKGRTICVHCPKCGSTFEKRV